MSKKEILQKILKLTEEYSYYHFEKNDFIENISNIPVSGKCIGKEELRNMVEASLDGWLTTGRFNDEFQKKLSALNASKKRLFCLATGGDKIFSMLEKEKYITWKLLEFDKDKREAFLKTREKYLRKEYP